MGKRKTSKGPPAWRRSALWMLAGALPAALLACLLCHLGRGRDATGEDRVSRLIDTYFQTWSDQDMDGYGECFAEEAVIVYVTPEGKLERQDLAPFLQGQRRAHLASPHPMREMPTSREISSSGTVCQAKVGWRLVAGSRTETGYDFFTFARTNGQWRIAALVFHGN
jgi:hypothetical protein